VSPAVFLRWMIRESRGARGRMLYFTACLAIGVAAVVGTAALGQVVEDGFRSKSREILGADLTVDARRPLPPELDDEMARVPGVERSDTLETATMASRPADGDVAAQSKLGLLYAVEGRYPLYGELVTDPPGGLEPHLRDDTVVAHVDLLHALDLRPGDSMRVGARTFEVAAAVLEEPGTLGFSSFLGPRLYVTRTGFEQTGLLAFGTRVRHRALFALPGEPSREELADLTTRLSESLPDAAYLDFDSHYDAGPTGRRSAQRIEGFVGLVALLSLVVGGIGVAQIVRTWVVGRTPSIAVLRCIGLRPREILWMSLAHTALLALAGSVLGVLAGCALPYAAQAITPDLFPIDVAPSFPLAAALRGLGLGVGLALAFSLPPLTAIWRVPPARVLRADADPLPANRAVLVGAAAALLLGVFGAAWVQAGDPLPAAWFTGGFVVLVAVLVLGSRGLMGLAGRLPRGRLHPYLVHGVAALARPGAGTTGAVVALGLGTMVVTSMWLVETRLRDAILGQVPPEAPSVFLLDIRPDQWPGVRAELETAGATTIDEVPLVMARIAAIDGRSVDDLAENAGGEGRSRRWLTREQRLSSRAALPADNRVIDGELWSDPELPEISLEQRFAERLGVGVGSVIEFDVQGVPLTLHITSLRSVEWQSFAINFFIEVEPGVLDRAPALFLSNARVPEDSEQSLQDRVAASFPNVTMLRVRPILEQVLDLLVRIAAGIRLLGSFTVAAGVMILAGAVSATALRRAGEVALLKTLGVTRPGVTALLATEYGLCGALAGAIGSGGALVLAWGYLRHVAEVDVTLPLVAFPVATLGCAAMTAICGVAASARALRVRPIEALR
jgi:putative ABC transport system permease protein